MANNEQKAPLARATLINGMVIAFEAIDATTGDPVAGVAILNAAILGDDGTDDGSSRTEPVVKLPDTTPTWASLPNL